MRIDLDAARAEAAAEPHIVDFGGDEFKFPPVSEWPLDAVDAIRLGDFKSAMELVLGGDWERFNGHRPTMGDMDRLLDAIAAADGHGSMGKSSGSSRSSKTTGKQ